MDSLTKSLSVDIRAARSTAEQLGILRDQFRGRTCALVSCGPSLKEVDATELSASLAGVPAIAVKQAIDLVGDQADFHCWNSYNVSKYQWQSRETLRCLIEPVGTQVPQWNPCDIRFPQTVGDGDLRNSLARQRDFGRHLLADSSVRPFGPGIMYELVIYLAVHLGCSRLITFGWDIADAAGRNTHFDDAPAERSFFERDRSMSASTRDRTWRERLPDPVRRAGRLIRTRIAHERGRRYNLTRPLIGESELVAESTVSLNAWLSSLGVELVVVTDSPHINGSIRRLSVEQALGELRQSRR